MSLKKLASRQSHDRGAALMSTPFKQVAHMLANLTADFLRDIITEAQYIEQYNETLFLCGWTAREFERVALSNV